MTTIKINGMSCNHCAMTVTTVLGGIEGIENVRVDLEKGEATFDAAESVDMSIVREKIRNAGYEVV